MSARRVLWLPLVGLMLTWSADGRALAADQSSVDKPSAGGLTGLLGVLSNPALPSLSGLIRPEKMGVLTDNQCRIQDNEPHLLSENEAGSAVLSGNETKLLSEIQILSGFTIEVHLHIHDSAMESPDDKAVKRDGKRDSRKAGKRKHGGTSKK